MSVANEMQLFQSEQFGQLRAIKDAEDNIWFSALDVAKALGFRDAGGVTRLLDEDEKGWSGELPQNVWELKDHNTRRKNGVRLINEPGFYRVVMVSRAESAAPFQRWVTHEVLPSIRRDGGYMVAKEGESDEELMARALLVAQKSIDRLKEQNAKHEATIEGLKPKAMFADAVAASDGTCLIGELAKMMRQNGLDIGQNRLFQRLQDDGYLGKTGSNRNVPTQRAMDMGLFRIKETAITHSDGHVSINRTPKVTGKGQLYFIKRYCKAVDDE